jgi:hypothetical protein
VKIRFLLPLAATAALLLIGCQKNSLENKEAIRRGVLDRLAKAGLSMDNMDVAVNAVEFHGKQAEADVEVTPKGGAHGQGMQIHYGLETQDGKWVVTRSSMSAGHGGTVAPGTVAPGTANPHGDGAMPAMPPGHGAMPSPQDLPPAKKQ